jgi:hypothetical protein
VQAAGENATNPLFSAFLDKKLFVDALRHKSLDSIPDRPLRPGESWTFSTKIAQGMAGDPGVRGTNTFQGIAPHDGIPCAGIASTASGENLDVAKDGADNEQAREMARRKTTMMSSTLKGMIWLDPALGIVRESVVTEQMIMSLKNADASGTHLSYPVETEFRVKVTKVEDAK